MLSHSCLVFVLLVSTFSLLVYGKPDDDSSEEPKIPSDYLDKTIKIKTTTVDPNQGDETTASPSNISRTMQKWVKEIDQFVETMGKIISTTINIKENINSTVLATLTAIGELTDALNITKNRNKEVEGGNIKSSDAVAFYLYSSKEDLSKGELIVINDTKNATESGYKSFLPLTLIVHGISDNFTSDVLQGLKDAYLKADIETNVIVVDWGLLSARPSEFFDLLVHPVTVQNFVTVGERIAGFIKFLISTSLLSGPEQVHIVGFGAGAHIAGIAGDRLKNSENRTQKSLNRITGLDPTGLFFLLVAKTNKLDKEDATFVDVVHTNQGISGYLGTLGHADFYPNGGGPYQPGCNNKSAEEFPGDCAHRKAYEYFRMSINKDKIMLGCECPMWFDKNCRKECKKSAIFGEHCPSSARGKYFLEISEDKISQQKQDTSSTQGNDNTASSSETTTTRNERSTKSYEIKIKEMCTALCPGN